MKCNVDIPYPKIKGISKNPDTARLLMHSYAGNISEETAIHLYLYQSVILKDENEEISKILAEISKVEMHHFHILAELIKELGVYPIYLDPVVDQHEFWTSKYVNYETDLKEILCLDMEAEKQAISEYNSLIHVIESEEVKYILKRIVIDERVHLEIFEKLLETISA